MNNATVKVQKNQKDVSALQLGSDTKNVYWQWRRVEDELPERNEVVIVCFKNGFGNPIRTLAYRVLEKGRSHWSTDLFYEEPDGYAVDDIDVTHWMPLPVIPQE